MIISAMEQTKPDHKLYRTYWGLYLPVLCRKLGVVPTERMKEALHAEFKKYLGYEHTSNMSEEQYRMFLYEVLVTAASELGIFIPSNARQPEDAEDMNLSDLWDLL